MNRQVQKGDVSMIQPDRLISKAEICRFENCSRTTLWRRVRQGKFPPPDISDGPGSPVKWWLSTYADWQRKRGGNPRELEPMAAA